MVSADDPEVREAAAVREELERRIAALDLVQPYRPRCHDPGQVLRLEATGVFPAVEAELEVEVLRRIGGGFAGQVYQVRLRAMRGRGGDEGIQGLRVGEVYAVKILIPPSGFSRAFRDALYGLAYQGAFSAQVNPDAIRAGALWQKLIRRGAALGLGREDCIVDVHATFFDEELRSFGEISEWVVGRTWRFEIDDALFARLRRDLDGELPEGAGSPEYLHKKRFMRDIVRHFHDMGAPELARQYEWWTLKSQPNALKRLDAGDGPGDGLTAIDFRAGLALLPFLPMSVADPWLIVRGLLRGRVVQFDRGDLDRLDEYLMAHEDHFADLRPAVAELVQRDDAYRASLPDVTHHHVHLLTRPELRRSVAEGFVTAWESKGLVDEEHAARLRASTPALLAFLLVGLLPVLGRPLRRVWGDERYREHVRRTLGSRDYFRRRFRARQLARLIDFHRDGRVDGARARRMADRPVSTWLVGTLLGWLPAGLYRLLTDWGHLKERVRHAVTYPIRLYVDAGVREEWLRDQVEDGRAEGMLDGEEADAILERIKEPYIQTYLKSVAVHACTLPVTQVVAALVALWYVLFRSTSWAEGMAVGTGIFVVFQGLPISPGSMVRGSYVVFLMIAKRDVRNYWIAAAVSMWHYIGYLAFPIQMVAKYPDLARFMAGNWATKMVRIIPVFGEKGALLEHWIFDGFFNLPLTLRRAVLRLVRRRRGGGGAGGERQA